MNMSPPFTKFPVFLQASFHSSTLFPGISFGYMLLTRDFLCSLVIPVLCLVALWCELALLTVLELGPAALLNLNLYSRVLL